ncbi:MAG: type II secretion system F family protein [Myxococcota bacterium]
MTGFLANSLSGYIAIALMGIGSGLFVYLSVALPNSPMKGKWRQYTAFLDTYIRFLLLRTTGNQIAQGQLVGICVCIILLILTGNVLLIMAIVLVMVLPWAWLENKRAQRVEELEAQLDSWLLMLSNSLKATPAIGEALRSTVNLTRPPMSEELDLMVKENQLGTPVDKVVLNASERMQSQTISGALATIVIARQTGGNLSEILETSAASLREMARLEGVVRTKTAEGKGQVIVLAVMPFAMSGILTMVDRNWLVPLTSNFIGYIILTISMTFWFVAIIWARKILAVDI